MKHALATASLVLAIAAPIALPAAAQDTTAVSDRSGREIHRTVIRQQGPGMGRGLIGLDCSPNGAERLEISFVRLSHRLDLTDTQQPLFDALRTKALTTQTSFADTCQAALPKASANEEVDMIDRFKAGLEVETARLAALTDVLPELEAFYGSLTDDQKANLGPGRNGRMDDRGNRADRDGPRRELREPAPGR